MAELVKISNNLSLWCFENPKRGKTYHWPTNQAKSNLTGTGLDLEFIDLTYISALPNFGRLITGEEFAYDWKTVNNEPRAFSLALTLPNIGISNKIILAFRKIMGGSPKTFFSEDKRFAFLFWENHRELLFPQKQLCVEESSKYLYIFNEEIFEDEERRKREEEIEDMYDFEPYKPETPKHWLNEFNDKED